MSVSNYPEDNTNAIKPKCGEPCSNMNSKGENDLEEGLNISMGNFSLIDWLTRTPQEAIIIISYLCYPQTKISILSQNNTTDGDSDLLGIYIYIYK